MPSKKRGKPAKAAKATTEVAQQDEPSRISRSDEPGGSLAKWTETKTRGYHEGAAVVSQETLPTATMIKRC
jgi:hypothetical protein